MTRSTRSPVTAMRLAAVGAAVAVTVTAGCMPAPAEPGEGELTGVIVRGDGTWPDGGLSVGTAHGLVLMSPADYSRLYSQQVPDRAVPATPGDMASASWVIPSEAVEREVTTGRWPVVVEAHDSRFRLPWDGRDAILCLVSGPQGDLLVVGCEPVPGQPPQAVVVYTGQSFALEPA
ncbi:MAG: hypothetical protein ACLGH4_02610 [Actinomycetes bacterium]